MSKKIYSYEGVTPQLGERVLLAPGSCVIGRVSVGSDVSVWPNVVLRGDINSITVGDRTNIQDNTSVHVVEKYPTIIGSDVTIGHNAIVHACIIEDGCMVGMGATVMDGAVIRTGSIVGAGALVTGGSEFPPHSLIIGSPAKVKRALSPEEVEGLIQHAARYCEVKDKHLASGLGD